jgi:hypothetical protein
LQRYGYVIPAIATTERVKLNNIWQRAISEAMDRRIAKMAALGRHFEVGNLYNYRNDIVIPGKILITFIVIDYVNLLHQ